MKTINYLVFILIIFSACEAEKTCDAFDKANNDLIPYEINDTIIFLSIDSLEFKIYIDDYIYSKEYIEMCPYFKISDCPCLNSVEILAINSNEITQEVFLEIEMSDISDMQYYKYQLLDFYFEIDFINELPYADDFDHIKYYEKLTLNNNEYANVAEINNINATKEGVNKVLVNKENGILKFYQKNSAIEWTIRE
ncbi:hypothetical protein ACFLTE_01060 [Bacteroidota bacterium]